MSKKQEEKQVTTEKSKKREVLEDVVFIAVAIFLAWALVTFVGQRTVVSGDSMNPTLHDKDNLITDKISYRFSDPKRFDIVVFPAEDEIRGKRNLIKRIIGLPGETVQIIDGQVYINGELLEEDIYGLENIKDPGRASEPITLGEDEYFVMGDNRNNSNDSRAESIGNITKKQLTGRAFIRIWPLSDFGVLKHQ